MRVYMHMCLCVYAHVSVGICTCVCSCLRMPDRVLDSLKVELQAVVKHLTWVLETDLGSSGTAASTVNY